MLMHMLSVYHMHMHMRMHICMHTFRSGRAASLT